MSASRLKLSVTAFVAALAAPAAALAQERLTPAGVFFDAGVEVKLVMAILLAATIAAAVVGVMKLASGPRLTGGSAYLSALRVGGPLLGLLGAAYVGLFMFIGITNAPTPPTITELAPGLAEIVMLLVLGFLAGGVAVAFHWAVEARIDRAVLKP